MRTRFTLLFLLLIFFVNLFAQNQGIDHAMISFWEGGEEDAFYNATDFEAHDFGTLNSESSLYLKSGQVFIWKNAEGDIIDVEMYYRLYKDGETPGEFINVDLPWHSEWDGEGVTNQLWWNDSPDEIDFNMLDGISDGDYVVEVYFQVEDGDNVLEYLNNGSQNYKATFTYSSATRVPETLLVDFDVYPNPVSEILKVKLFQGACVETVELIDCSSRVVYSVSQNFGISNKIINIPVQNLGAGTYFIRIKSENGTQVKRVIIVD